MQLMWDLSNEQVTSRIIPPACREAHSVFVRTPLCCELKTGGSPPPEPCRKVLTEGCNTRRRWAGRPEWQAQNQTPEHVRVLNLHYCRVRSEIWILRRLGYASTRFCVFMSWGVQASNNSLASRECRAGTRWWPRVTPRVCHNRLHTDLVLSVNDIWRSMLKCYTEVLDKLNAREEYWRDLGELWRHPLLEPFPLSVGACHSLPQASPLFAPKSAYVWIINESFLPLIVVVLKLFSTRGVSAISRMFLQR